MVITEKLRQRFAKDTGLPIKIFVEPYFSHLLELYDQQYDAKTKWEQFLSLLENSQNEQEYFVMYNKVKDDAINYLANNPEMQHFSREEDMNKFSIVNKGYPSNSIFKQPNIGRHFVSIDMVKANFTALRHYDKKIVGGKETYEEFVGMFTEHAYLKSSKYIRQVIFGNQNPKRQTTYERFLMDKVLSSVLAKTHLIPEEMAYFGTDEIVLDITEHIRYGKLTESFFALMNEALAEPRSEGINVRTEYFQLLKIKGSDGYVKKFEFIDAHKGVDFKCVESLEMPFVIRAYNNEKPVDNDLVFVYEGRLAKLLEPIKVEFTDVCDINESKKGNEVHETAT